MPRPTSFNFAPIIPLVREEKWFVTLRPTGSLIVPKEWAEKYQFKNHHIQFLADNDKRVLGFRKLLIEGSQYQNVEEIQEKFPTSRYIGDSHLINLGIKKILDDLPWFVTPENSRRIRLRHHEIKGYGGGAPQDIWYFSLEDDDTEDAASSDSSGSRAPTKMLKIYDDIKALQVGQEVDITEKVTGFTFDDLRSRLYGWAYMENKKAGVLKTDAALKYELIDHEGRMRVRRLA